MTEVRALSVWQNIKNFFAAHTLAIIGGLLLLLFAVFFLGPGITVLIKSVFGPEGFTLQYYEAFAAAGYYYRSLMNTVILGSIVTPLCLSIAFCLAYVRVRGPTYLRAPAKVLALLPLITPGIIYGLSIIIFFGRNGIITNALNLGWDIYGFVGCIIAQSIAYIPLAFLIIESSMISLNPNLEESAANLGATGGQILRHVTIPLLMPSFLKAALVVFAQTVTAFGNIALLSGRVPFLAPDTYKMITGAQYDMNMASVLATFLILLCMIVFFVQGRLTKGKSYTTIVGKPVATEPKPLARSVSIPMLVVFFGACSFILLTFGVVVIGSFTELVGVNNEFTLSHILNADVMLSISNSLKVAIVTGLLGALVGVLVAYVVVRGKFMGHASLEAIALVAFAFPGTALGIGYILTFKKPPLKLTGTFIILVLNCLIRTVTVGVVAAIAKLRQLSIEVEEASTNLGASTFTTFRRIVLPIIFPTFMYGFIYVFIRTMKTLSSVVFLASPGNPMLSTYIFLRAYEGRLGLSCAATLKLMAIVGVCVAALHYLSKWGELGGRRRRL